MKKKILVGVLLGAMLVSMVGCKKQGDGGAKDSSGKRSVKTEDNQGVEAQKTPTPVAIGEDMFLYKDEFYGYSFVMPKYTRGDYLGAAYVRQNLLGADNLPELEKYIGVFRYIQLSHEDYVDINQINTVYDIPEVFAEMAFTRTLRSINSITLLSYNIEVADQAETINGYEMLRYEGTMEVEWVLPYTFGITGYFILADGLPIVVQAVDASSNVSSIEYDTELSLMDSLRADVDAMVRTFSMEGWYGREFR